MRAPRLLLLSFFLVGCGGNVVVDGTNSGSGAGGTTTTGGGSVVSSVVGSGGAPGVGGAASVGGAPAQGGFGGIGGSPATTTHSSAIASTAISSTTIASSVASGIGCNCPDPGDACTQPLCSGSTCAGSQPAPSGTKCGASGTKFCDGSGRCLACRTAADCGPPQTLCEAWTCSNGACELGVLAPGTQCGPHTICNGEDCTGCNTINDCPPSPQCGIVECENNFCIIEGNTVDTPCKQNDGSAGFCRGGFCVECDSDGDCPAPNFCIAQECHPAHCKDHSLDVDETDVDCGGSCGGCARNKKCNGDQDCKSNHCFQGLCH